MPAVVFKCRNATLDNHGEKTKVNCESESDIKKLKLSVITGAQARPVRG